MDQWLYDHLRYMVHKPCIILVTLLLLAILPGRSFSQAANETDVVISELTATTSDTHVLLFGTLRNSLTEEMIEGLHSGVPIHFSFFVELLEQSKTSSTRMLATLNFTHTLTYDTLKESYRVELQEDSRKNFSFASLLDAQKVLNDLNGIKVVPLAQLTADATYTLKIRAELFNKTLPLSLQHVIPFISWWDIKTDWQTLKFKY